MKTIGERVQQARIAREMSGERLARAVGYKNQSSISNLEGRINGFGGKKLPLIAKTLRVPLEWLVSGPDSDEVPFSEPSLPPTPLARHTTHLSDLTGNDAAITEAVQLFRQLNNTQRMEVVNQMRRLLKIPPDEGRQDNGTSYPPAQAKAA